MCSYAKLTPNMSRYRAEAEAAIVKIIAGGRPADFESPTLDFKEDKATVAETEKMVAEAVVCFANGGGGTLVLGARDKASGPAALVGTALEVEQVQQRVYELTDPPVWGLEVTRHHRHPQLMMISVTQSAQVHADRKGRATRRINTACVPMNPSQVAALQAERSGQDASSKPSGRSIGNASGEAIAVARRMLAKFNDERRLLATASVEDLLGAVGTFSTRGDLNLAGELMFCEPSDPSVVAVLYQYRATPGGEARVVQRLAPPLVLAFSRALELIEARSTAVPITLRDGQQFEIRDFPEVAAREALSNALCHRELQVGEPVTIEHSPTVLRVTSPGPLMTGVTPNNIITTPSRPRNRALASIARKLGLAEELGSGVDRMIRAMIGSGRQIPKIEDDASRVYVTFIGGAPNTAIAKFVAQLPDEEREDTDTLLLLFHLCQYKTATALTLAPWLQKTEEEAESVLRRLASDEVALVESTRATAARSSPTYRLRSEVLRALGSAVAYNRRTMDEIDRKVIAHLREYGKVTNNTLKNLFDIDVYRARDLIASLAQRGILVRTSDASRGPTVTWGPGPKFPAARSRPKRDRSVD